MIAARVLTSQWCRCRDTAKLLDVGPVEDLTALNSFFRNPDRADRQTAELRQILLGLPREETVILVTHFVNIRALTGRGVASGEILLLEIVRDETISVVDEILIAPPRRERPRPNSRPRTLFLDGRGQQGEASPPAGAKSSERSRVPARKKSNGSGPRAVRRELPRVARNGTLRAPSGRSSGRGPP